MSRYLKYIIASLALVAAGLSTIKNASASLVSVPFGVKTSLDGVNVSESSFGGAGHIVGDCSGVSGHFLVSNEGKADLKAAIWNTYIMKEAIECSTSEYLNLVLPSGTFYFVSSGSRYIVDDNYGGDYAIYLRDGLSIKGAGTEATILKPYAVDGEVVDMFAYYGFENNTSKSAEALGGVHFEDFTIDGSNSSGKGFEINVIEDSSWNNVLVKNMGDIGFDIGAPSRVTIENSSATDCGRVFSEENTEDGSGFVIRNGYTTDESISIKNSYALWNKGFGFFFGHQSRSNPERYTSDSGAVEGKAFKIENSEAVGNGINYGGKRANDVYIKDSGSSNGGSDLAVSGSRFNDQSRRVTADNLQITENPFSDVTDPSAYYYDAVKWGAETGITVGKDGRQYGVDDEVMRADAIIMLWRYSGRAGSVLSYGNGLLDENSDEITDESGGCFGDLPEDAYYLRAIRWGYENELINGVKGCTSDDARDGEFSPTTSLKRSEVLALMKRLDERLGLGGGDSGSSKEFEDVKADAWYYDDVKWASKKGILDDIVNGNYLEPEKGCTRAEFITLLWRTVGKPVSTDTNVERRNYKEVTNKHAVRFHGMGRDMEIFVDHGGVVEEEDVKELENVDDQIFGGWLYSDGEGEPKEYSFGSPVETDLDIYAQWVPVVGYTKEGKGKWIFMNQPEMITRDVSLNRGKILHVDQLVSGTNEIYWEHNDGNASDDFSNFAHVFRIHNGSGQDTSIRIKRCGSGVWDGKTWYARDTWDGYYDNKCSVEGLGREVSISSGGDVFITQLKNGFYVSGDYPMDDWHPARGSYNYQIPTSIFDGVLEIYVVGTDNASASRAGLDISEVVYMGGYNGACDPGYCSKLVDAAQNVTNKTYADSELVYSGYYDKLPVVTNDMVYKIYDWTPSGVLPLAYSRSENYDDFVIKPNGETYADGWRTNGYEIFKNDFYADVNNNKKSDDKGGDIVNLKVDRTAGWETVNTKWNWANWAVHYVEEIKIENNSNSAKTVSLEVKSTKNTEADKVNGEIPDGYIMLKCEGENFKWIPRVQFPGNKYDVGNSCQKTIPAHESGTIKAEVTLGGMSCGDISKRLVLK